MINKNTYHFSQGLTLIELLIASVLSVIIFLIIANTLLNGLRARNRTSAVTEIQKANARILSDITNEIRWAKSAEVTGLSDTLIITNKNNDIITYENNSGQLTKTFSSGSPSSATLHSNKVEVTSFSLIPYPNASNLNRVTVDLTLSHKDYTNLILNTTNTVSMRISQIGT